MTLHSLLQSVVYEGKPKVAALVEKPAPGVHVRVSAVDVLEGVGFSGDHARKSWWKGEEIPGRQVTAVAQEVLEALGVAWDVPGDNLVTSGVDLTALKEGDRLKMGDVVLVRTAKPHRPCDLFARRTSEEARQVIRATGTRGALFVVEKGGEVHRGQPIEVMRMGKGSETGTGASAAKGAGTGIGIGTVVLFIVVMFGAVAGCGPSPEMVAGHDVYTRYCALCHQPDGAGVSGAFPPLTDSEWVQGDEGRLIRLVLNGMQGPITVHGQEYNNVMTPHAFLTDEQIANVLTWVRSSFENDAGPVTVEQVARVREANTQDGLWLVSELEGQVGIP